MIALALAAVTILATPGGDAARFKACTDLIRADPAAAVTQAQAWADGSKDVPAHHCLGLAQVAAEHWPEAATTFEGVATTAEAAKDRRAAGLWSQGGNAALAAGDYPRARRAIDRALALATLPPPMQGEAYMDRARADVALDDLTAGRGDLDRALKLVPQDPFAWLLSATLARRQNDLPRAVTDIAEAVRLAGDAPAVMLEQGNVAWAGGHVDAARAAWTRTAQVASGSPEGRTAAASLAHSTEDK